MERLARMEQQLADKTERVGELTAELVGEQQKCKELEKQCTAAELINLPERGVVNAWMRQSVLELSLHCGLSAMCVLHGWFC
jgi:hypothetical protein